MVPVISQIVTVVFESEKYKISLKQKEKSGSFTFLYLVWLFDKSSLFAYKSVWKLTILTSNLAYNSKGEGNFWTVFSKLQS